MISTFLTPLGGNKRKQYDGEVLNFSSLPTATSENNGHIYLVTRTVGTDQSGFYKSNGSDWALLGNDYDTLDDISEGSTNKHFTGTNQTTLSTLNSNSFQKKTTVHTDFDNIITEGIYALATPDDMDNSPSQFGSGVNSAILQVYEYDTGNGIQILGASDRDSSTTHNLMVYRCWEGNIPFRNFTNWVSLINTDTNTTYSVGDGELSENNLTTSLKNNYDTAYTHSQATHAPASAEQNVQSDWDSGAGDSQILNKPTTITSEEQTKVGHITISQAVDLDTMEASVSTNNAKITNATHTGDVTGSTALTISDESVTNAKLAHIATGTVKGRTTASTGDVEDLDIDTTLKTALNLAKGDVGLGSVPNTDCTNASNIASGTLDVARLPTINAAQVDGLEASQFLRSDADDSFTGSITGFKSDGAIITLDGGGPNILRWLDDGSTTKAIDLVYRTTPNTLGCEKSDDGTIMWETDCDTGTTDFKFQPTYNGAALLTASFLKVSNTNTSTDINTSSWVDVPLTGTTDIDYGSGFEVNGDGIKCLFSGYVRASSVISFTSTVARIGLVAQFAINGTRAGAKAKSSYIRNSGHNDSASESLTEIFEVSINDTIVLKASKNIASGTVKLQGTGNSNLILERIS